MERTKCIVCEDTLNELYSISNAPISLSVTEQNYDEDIFNNQILQYCQKCSCVQLKNLIDPTVLYGTSHNLTYTHPTWDAHHTSFSQFILDTLDTLDSRSNTLMEIGGSSGALYNKLKNTGINYSCIDLCAPSFDTTGITYITGNCEDYVFNDVECVAMSHVFEHLYDPNKFINNMFENQVKTIYVSIPNMHYLLENNSTSIIHYEHTYFVDDVFIKYLFSKKSYCLTDTKKFKNHSIFYKFVLAMNNTNTTITELPKREYIKDIMLDIHSNLTERFRKYVIPENSFIIPAGHMGQLVCNVAKPTSILGFLDNDKGKQGKRQYGTKFNIYPFDELKKYDTTVNIFIYAGVYLNELLIQLEEYKNINVHIF